jgi:hypothetical protein
MTSIYGFAELLQFPISNPSSARTWSRPSTASPS